MSDPAERPLLFVYGTLRAGARHPMHALVSQGGQSLGAGRVQGRLLRVDWYPGLVLSGPTGWVLGEVWRLRDATVLEPLDRYEGCGPEDPRPHEYDRVRVQVQMADGSRRQAWTYVYRGSQRDCEDIPGGDWLARDDDGPAR